MEPVSAALYIPTIVFNCVFIYFYPRAFFKKSEGDILIASVRPPICLLCYLLLNHWTKFNQIWCVIYSHEWGVQRQTFRPAPWGPGKGSKGKVSFNFNYKVDVKDLCTKLCMCSHKRKIQSISDGIFILSPGSCPRGRTLGRWGAQGVNLFYFKHGQLAYQIDGDDEQNRVQVKFSPYGQTGDLGMRSKGQI